MPKSHWFVDGKYRQNHATLASYRETHGESGWEARKAVIVIEQC